MLNLLIENGINLNHLDYNGNPPLFWDPRNKMYTKRIISAGADINIPNVWGYDALTWFS